MFKTDKPLMQKRANILNDVLKSVQIRQGITLPDLFSVMSMLKALIFVRFFDPNYWQRAIKNTASQKACRDVVEMGGIEPPSEEASTQGATSVVCD